MSEPGARHWRPRGVPTATPVPRRLKPWIDEPGSLTRRLRHLAGEDFAVRVIRECWSPGWPDERLRLRSGLRGALWLREVLLCRGHQPLIYARSVIPATSLRGPLRRLRALGRQPLGTLLFGRYPVRRGAIEIAPVSRRDRLGRRAADCGGAPVWARRSVFRIAGRPLLVTEVFLAELLEELGDDNGHR